MKNLELEFNIFDIKLLTPEELVFNNSVEPNEVINWDLNLKYKNQLKQVEEEFGIPSKEKEK